jgi:amidase
MHEPRIVVGASSVGRVATQGICYEDYAARDALGLAELVRRGEVTPAELLALAIERADDTHEKLNAIVRRLDGRARARAAETFDPRATFAGVPFLVKDLYQEIAGVPSTSGSRAVPTRPAVESSDVTRRWEAAGLVIFGMTNCSEFGGKSVTESLLWGPARNPWDLSKTPGGSSGGAAAAVAAGVVPVAGANDGGGSIRIPAASCGLFGFKAGRGRISSGPSHAEGINGSAVHGVVSRSVRDSAAMLDVLQGPERHGPYYMAPPAGSYLAATSRPPDRLKIGFCSRSPLGLEVDAEAVAAVNDAARLLSSLGHEVEEASPDLDGVQLAQDFLLSWFCELGDVVEQALKHGGAQRSQFEPDTRTLAACARRVSALELLQSQARWNDYNRSLARFHDRYDCWLTPTLAAPPLSIGQLDTPRALQRIADAVCSFGLAGVMRKTGAFQASVLQGLAWTPFTQLANLTGRPAMSVPLYWTAQDLPLGVQFVAGLNGEEMLLRLAAQLEQERPWFARRPSLECR